MKRGSEVCILPKNTPSRRNNSTDLAAIRLYREWTHRQAYFGPGSARGRSSGRLLA